MIMYIAITVVVIAVIIGIVFNYKRSKKINEKGVEVAAAVLLAVLLAGCTSPFFSVENNADGSVSVTSQNAPKDADGSMTIQAEGDDPAVTEALAADIPVELDEEFGGVYIDLTTDEFNALGFACGDGVTVTFSNGYTLEDIPYYSGYYTQNGEALLIAYPGYPHIKACINNGDSLWLLAGLSEGDTATVTLTEHAAYLDIQQARDIRYEDDRALYASDVVFANFRSVEAGAVRADMLYRSASPCDNQHNRAPYVDALMAEAGVAYILDLADTDEKIQGYLEDPAFNSPCFLTLYEAGLVDPIALNMNFGSDTFKEKLAAGLTDMTEHAEGYLAGAGMSAEAVAALEARLTGAPGA